MKPRYYLSEEHEVLFNLSFAKGEIDTVNGSMLYKNWVEKEAARINRTNPDREARVIRRKGLIGVEARCYYPTRG